jgi:hypothetical protein
MIRPICASFLVLLAGIAAYGQASPSKPNLSGTWVFDSQKSALKMPGPSALTLQIDQSDPKISFARTMTYGDQNFTWKLEAMSDGQKEVVDNSGGLTTNSRVYWQGNALVVDQKITAEDGTKVEDMVTYTLEDGGNSLEALERETAVGGKGATTNKWMYAKKTN